MSTERQGRVLTGKIMDNMYTFAPRPLVCVRCQHPALLQELCFTWHPLVPPALPCCRRITGCSCAPHLCASDPTCVPPTPPVCLRRGSVQKVSATGVAPQGRMSN